MYNKGQHVKLTYEEELNFIIEYCKARKSGRKCWMTSRLVPMPELRGTMLPMLRQGRAGRKCWMTSRLVPMLVPMPELRLPGRLSKF